MKPCKFYEPCGKCTALVECNGKLMPCKFEGNLNRCLESIKQEVQEGKYE